MNVLNLVLSPLYKRIRVLLGLWLAALFATHIDFNGSFFNVGM